MNLKKLIFIVIGSLSLGLGCVGIVLPLLPTVPFFLLTAFCFAKSSRRLHAWFIGSKPYQKYLEPYAKKKGMTAKTKLTVLLSVTLLMGFGFFMMGRVPVGQIALAVVWACHLLFLLFGVKTLREEPNPPSYASCRKIRVEGMRCEACAHKLECALNAHGRIQAKVDFPSRIATVYLERPQTDKSLVRMVDQAGYKAERIWETA